MSSDMNADIRKEWTRQMVESYTRTIDERLTHIIRSKTGLTVPDGGDKEAVKTFIEINGLTIIATPPALPTIFVVCQHGETIGRFDLIDWITPGGRR
jgi:hypothetical protein